MRWIAYRNFIKKVYVHEPPENSSFFNSFNLFCRYFVLTKEKLITTTQIQIDKYCLPFLKKFDPNSSSICIDELVVIIANLIHIGYIRGVLLDFIFDEINSLGYISQKSNILVVSKSNAFPPIRSVSV